MGDDYLRIALSSDEDFAAAKVAEDIAQRRAGLFESLIRGDHIVLTRRN
jgi:hypothetical protein